MSRYSKRLAQLEIRLAQRQEIADAEGLKELAEITRAKILDAIDRHKRGEPMVQEAVEHHHSPARERLLVRLREMRERLLRYAELRDTYGIR